MGYVVGIAVTRQRALGAAYERTPERFVAGRPIVARPPERVMLNPLDAAEIRAAGEYGRQTGARATQART